MALHYFGTMQFWQFAPLAQCCFDNSTFWHIAVLAHCCFCTLPNLHFTILAWCSSGNLLFQHNTALKSCCFGTLAFWHLLIFQFLHFATLALCHSDTLLLCHEVSRHALACNFKCVHGPILDGANEKGRHVDLGIFGNFWLASKPRRIRKTLTSTRPTVEPVFRKEEYLDKFPELSTLHNWGYEITKNLTSMWLDFFRLSYYFVASNMNCLRHYHSHYTRLLFLHINEINTLFLGFRSRRT